MKKHHWPQPPSVIDLILDPTVEDSFYKSMVLWGTGFVLRTEALTLIALIGISFGVYIPQKSDVNKHPW
ncbi:MAG: hypothetical protein P8M36_04880 [Gammaproteobacteria bacterium]|nr:hypothetical protein [Gammaproteobacteria bacterium]